MLKNEGDLMHLGPKAKTKLRPIIYLNMILKKSNNIKRYSLVSMQNLLGFVESSYI